ncbi:hypothetical protein DER45DRAFT_537642 [Fusarium avenaceum]|nr:hypothetical protein DER45DRAFT_537642 [Fusarium avenaceum]
MYFGGIWSFSLLLRAGPLTSLPDSTVVGTNISKPTRNLAQTIPPDWLNHLNRTAKTRTMPRNVTLTVRSMGYLADLQYIRLVSNTEYTVSADESIVAQGRDALLFEDANK